MINLSERVYIKNYDDNNWIVVSIKDTVNPKTKEPMTKEVISYYPDLERACIAGLDKCLKNCESVEELVEELNRVKSLVRNLFKVN